ncbi:hypothetical protein JL721_12886 [Aureococcus anophagefferens]|nr:hypothetical protein JL721_12886 [Aureococcus anophagefferens]
MVREPPSDGPDEAVGPSAVSPYCVDFNKIPALEPYQLVCYAGPIFAGAPRPPPADAEARSPEPGEIARMETKIDQAPRRRVSAFFGVNRDEFGAKRKRDDKSRLLARAATKGSGPSPLLLEG